MIKVAIIGTGNISPAHIKSYMAFPERCKIVALCDIYPEKAEARKKEYSLDAEVVAAHTQLLGRSNIDLVSVCTPPYVHSQIACDFLNDGKHVIVEKPMAVSLERCDAMMAAEKQYLFFADVKDATVVRSQIANYNHPDYPELDDFGEAMLVGDNGTTNYFRVDWFTPNGLSTWGDGRTVILGTDGDIELRKYVNVGMDKSSDHIFLVDGKGEHHLSVQGQVGYPFFGALILDCLNRTETAMTQEHAFKAAGLCVKAQMQAVKIS